MKGLDRRREQMHVNARGQGHLVMQATSTYGTEVTMYLCIACGRHAYDGPGKVWGSALREPCVIKDAPT